MSRKPTITVAIVLVIGIAWAVNWRSTTAQDQAAIVAPANESESVEVLARGPVHEAFAEPVNLQGFDPLVIEVAPPEPVEELPPDQRPEGDNVEWIPGYWAWDDERDSFLWVSGVWRDCPPGQRWLPGYWSEDAGGWNWTAGFWISEEAEELAYLPEPPETLEVGPQIEAPSEDHVWVPGTWRYHETRYVWQPGYYTVMQPGWVWVPARYTWCPTGYVFVDGYWDYPLEERGVLFAPVYYHQPVYQQASYYYTPSVVISTEILTVHLFARPRYCHYYFGDYYAPRYREIGIEPWLMFPRIRGCYDPLYHYYGWHHRRHGRGDWHRHVRDRYEFFAEHEDYRPAHTYDDLRRQRFDRDRIRTGDINIDNSIQNIVVQQNNLAVNINQYVRNESQDLRIDGDRGARRGRMRFARLDDDERRRYGERARDIRGFQERRSELESESRIAGPGDRGDRDDRGQVARGDRGARRSLRLADFEDGRGDREGGERGDRRGRGRDRAEVAADVPPTPGQTAGGTGGTTEGAQDATAGAGRDRRGRSFDRPGRQDTTPDQDRARDAVTGRNRTRDQDAVRDTLGGPVQVPGQDAARDTLGQEDATREREQGRDAVGRRGRGRDNSAGLGRAGRDGPQFPGARNQGADRGVTTQTPSDATTTPGGASVTDPTSPGTTANERLEALRRGRGGPGERARGPGGLDATDRTNNTGGLPGARQGRGFGPERRIIPHDSGTEASDQQRSEQLRRRQQSLRDQLGIDNAQRGEQGTRRNQSSDESQRGRSSLRGGQNPFGEAQPDATGRGFPRGLGESDASDLRNRQLRARGDENRSQADPLRQRGFNRDALGSRGQSGEDAAQRAMQSQRQEAFRRQLDAQRGDEQRNQSNNLERLLNQQREAGRQRGVGSDAQPFNRQQFERGRSGSDSLRGRGNDRTTFGDPGQRESETRRRAFGSSPNQQSQRPSLDFGQQGGQTPGFDPRSRMQRGGEGRSDNDARGQFRPEGRSAFGGRGGGGGDGGRAEALQRLNRGGGGEAMQRSDRGGERGGGDALQQFNRGGGGRSFSRQQEQPPQATGGNERGGRSGGEDRRGGRGGGRGRDRDDDD